ncbi:MAG: glycoside hydrolase family 13 protein [Clostridiales bacterium]|nr:glycoside hydrolase family 13 protein [Clostridiales bacterium]MBE5746713.1 glycoside hydrolase family 13 protein [Clostridiales bacterium]
MQFYFNPLDPACKNVVGGIKQGEILQLNIFCLKNEVDTSQNYGEKGVFSPKTPASEDCVKPNAKAFLRLNHDGEAPTLYPMITTDFGWTISLSISGIGLYFYSFTIENVGNIACGHLEMGYLTSSDHVDGFLLTVSSADYRTPDWFKGGVMYQIFPDRFCKVGNAPVLKGRINREDWGGTPSFLPNEQGKVLNNDFFGGNFKGIESKLPYLKDLGVTVIYCNPIFEAASNHRYDTSDYMKIDPMLGNEQDFDDLVKAAKKLGICVILDGVFNHTGDNSVYFNKYGEYPNVGAYQSKDSPYYSWYVFKEFPNKYESWWGIDILPEVNKNSAEYQNFIFGKGGVLKKWLGFGIGGYRLDVADELPDFFLKKLRKSVKEEDENAIIIGEVWEDASNKIAYSTRREYLQGYELDSVMNYPLKDAIIAYIQTGRAVDLAHCIRVLISHYPKETLDCLMNILGTHDTVRILTVLGGIHCQNKQEMAQDWAFLNENARKNAIEKLKMAAVLQFTAPGVPSIYYGDENGMEGHIDPFCRRCFDWEHLNEDLIAFYKKLGKIREEYREIFKDGMFELLRVDEGFFFYKRTKNEKEIYVYTNNSSKSYLLNLPEDYKDCFSEQIIKKEINVEPYSYKIFVKSNS